MSEQPRDGERSEPAVPDLSGPAGPDDETVVIEPVGTGPRVAVDAESAQVDPDSEASTTDRPTGSADGPDGPDEPRDEAVADADVPPAGPDDVTVVLDATDVASALGTEAEPPAGAAGPDDVTVLLDPSDLPAPTGTGVDRPASDAPEPTEPAAASAAPVPVGAGPGDVTVRMAPLEVAAAVNRGSDQVADPVPGPVDAGGPAPTAVPAAPVEPAVPVEPVGAVEPVGEVEPVEPVRPWFHLERPSIPVPARATEPVPEPAPELAPELAPESATEPADAPVEPGPPVERARSRLFASMRPRANRGQLLAALLCAGLGFGLVAQVRATQSVELAQLRQSDLVRLLQQVNDESEKLSGEEAAARAARDKLVDSQTSGREAEAQARERLRVLGVLAGTVAARGPGIRLVVADPKGEVDAASLLDILQELRDAGAEAVQIGGVRVVASTAFEDVEGGVKIGSTTVRTPYTYLVIGDPDTLSAAMRIPGGVLDSIEQKGGTGTVTRLDRVDITALHPLPTPQYARPAPDGAS